uniref:Uncharacterized protein n=1 Tax=Branchiostoma floridae TaxID=7739 RepID=C3ZNW5_BRAFL|eukprot:XP_002589689.1 hypothetical protein BRAFLDRAFT_100816 [Branchiostoma floridae]
MEMKLNQYSMPQSESKNRTVSQTLSGRGRSGSSTLGSCMAMDTQSTTLVTQMFIRRALGGVRRLGVRAKVPPRRRLKIIEKMRREIMAADDTATSCDVTGTLTNPAATVVWFVSIPASIGSAVVVVTAPRPPTAEERLYTSPVIMSDTFTESGITSVSVGEAERREGSVGKLALSPRDGVAVSSVFSTASKLAVGRVKSRNVVLGSILPRVFTRHTLKPKGGKQIDKVCAISYEQYLSHAGVSLATPRVERTGHITPFRTDPSQGHITPFRTDPSQGHITPFRTDPSQGHITPFRTDPSQGHITPFRTDPSQGHITPFRTDPSQGHITPFRTDPSQGHITPFRTDPSQGHITPFRTDPSQGHITLSAPTHHKAT